MENSNPLIELLFAERIVINKKLARKIGLNEAIVYSELLSKYLDFEKSGELEDGYFCNTIEELEEETTLSVYQQRKAISNLVKQGFITYQLQRIPAKRYFKILKNEEKFKEIFK